MDNNDGNKLRENFRQFLHEIELNLRNLVK